MSRRPSPPPASSQNQASYLSQLGTSSGFIPVTHSSGGPSGTHEGSYDDEDGTVDTHGGSGSRDVAGRSTEQGHAPPTYVSTGQGGAIRAASGKNGKGSSGLRGPRPLAGPSTSTAPPVAYSQPPPMPPLPPPQQLRSTTPAAKSTITTGPIHASPFERPQFPNDVWTDDTSTIFPEDSVSQLARKATSAHPRMKGPRPLPGPSPVPEESSQSYAWVPPEMLEDDRSTIVPQQQSQRAPSRGYGQSGEAAAYYGEEDGVEGPNDSSAQLPLVAGAAPMSRVGGSGVESYRGYNAVGEDGFDQEEGEEEEDAYGQWRNNQDVENGRRGMLGMGTNSSRGLSMDEDGVGSGSGGIRAVGASVLSAPLSYMKSLRGGSTGKTSFYDVNGDNTYPPTISREYSGGASSSKELPTPSEAKPWWSRVLYDTTPNEIRIEEHKRGLGVQKRSWACWTLSLIMVGVLIYELVHMKNETGSPIQTKPNFNVMIGPSGSVLINMGARFAGCLKDIPNVSNISWICLPESNSKTVTAADATCTMSDICGFGGFPEDTPNQSFRFFIPIFLHAGVIHIALNLLAQCVSSAQIERQMGTPRFLLLYFPSGIFGFVLGANFALVGQPSVGASGAIFGTHAAILVDLLAHWDIEYRPVRKLLYLLLEIIVGLLLGLVPGVDNFAHLGGFCIGLLASIVLFPIIHQTKRHRIIFIILRLIAAPLIVVMFVVLIRNFYQTDPTKACSWCRYLSCWPTASNNHCKGTGLQTISTTLTPTSIITFLLTFLPFL